MKHIDTVDVEKRVLVGIDIGTTNFLSCSDEHFDKIFSYKSDKLPKMVKKYNETVRELRNNSRLSIAECEQIIEQPKQDIESYISKIIRNRIADMVHTLYPENALFVIGNNNSKTHKTSSWGVNSIINKVVIQTLEDFFVDIGVKETKVVDIIEHNTSIICPKCKQSDPNNRQLDNSFQCKNPVCNYYHEVDDVVASVNIARRYREESTKIHKLTHDLQVLNY